jgi:hypothetical protein
MSLIGTLRRLWETRHLNPYERAKALNPDIAKLSERQHEQINREFTLQLEREVIAKRAQQERGSQ